LPGPHEQIPALIAALEGERAGAIGLDKDFVLEAREIGVNQASPISPASTSTSVVTNTPTDVPASAPFRSIGCFAA